MSTDTATTETDLGKVLRDQMFRKYRDVEHDPDYVKWEDIDGDIRAEYVAGAAAVRAEVERELVGRVERLANNEYMTVAPMGYVNGVSAALAALKGQDETNEAIPE